MLRRPMLYVAVVYTAAILIAFYEGIIFSMAVTSMGLIILWVMGRYKKVAHKIESFLWLLLVVFLVGALNFQMQYNHKDSFEEMVSSGETVTINGEIRTIENKGESQHIVVKGDDGARCLLKIYEKQIHGVPGQHIRATGEISLPEGKKNPNCFDYRLYLKTKRIHSLMTVRSCKVSPDRKINIEGILYKKKENYIEELQKVIGKEEAGLIRGIVFGEKCDIEEETLETFRRNGTAHILAVSGLHIGIIYGFILKLWTFIIGRLPFSVRLRGRTFLLCVSLFFFCYMVLANFSPSVVRAVIMVLIHAYAQLTSRRYDLISAAIIVSLGMLLVNPIMLFNLGFQMSFLAVLTMSLAMPYVKSICSGVISGSMAIQVGLGPFVLYNFNYLSLVAIFINIPIIALTGTLVPLGIAGGFLGGIFKEFCYGSIGGLCKILVWMNKIVEFPGVTTFLLGSPHPRWIAIYYLVLLFIFSEAGRRIIRRKGIKSLLMMILIALILGTGFGAMADDGFRKMEVTFIDVGQGCSIHIREDGGNYLIDGGGKENYNVGKSILKPYLLKNGVKRIDGAFVTHLHSDHYKGICELAQLGMIKKLYVYEANSLQEGEILKETGLSKNQLFYIHGGEEIKLGEISLHILSPDKKSESEYMNLLAQEEDENSLSLIIRGDLKFGRLLVTGDIDEQGELELLKKDIEADLLQVAHHGSRFSSCGEFLEAVDPKVAVIPVGRNSYGHPTEEAIQRLKNAGANLYRTDLNGAVGIKKDGSVVALKK